MSSKFDICNFISDFEISPSEHKVGSLKRSELFEVAKYYDVSVLTSMKKADLRAVLVEFFVDEGMIEMPTQKAGSEYTQEAVIRLKELKSNKESGEKSN